MDEKGVFDVTSEDKVNSLYPMLFGVSCAFSALKLLPEPEICGDDKWLEIRNSMLIGSAHLLGLLVWRVQKDDEAKCGDSRILRNARRQIEELKRLRREDARANEKVVCIVSAREQSWFDERKKLRQQIGSLMNELRVLEVNKAKTISELNEKLKECESVLQSKDKKIEEGEQKRVVLEETVKKAENVENELRELLKSEAQRHSSEISRHKTAFIELVSNQRQLEAEMGRAVRQVEAVKQELDSVLEVKDDMVLMNQRLSMELVKMRHDSEQKDQVLSAMLRKSKLDAAEKQMLLKEVKSSKVKRKQAEVEIEKWKSVSESKNERHSLRNMLSKRLNAKGVHSKNMMMTSLDGGNFRSVKKELFKNTDTRKGLEALSLEADPYSIDGAEEPQLLTADVEHLENWITSEAEVYKVGIEQRHNLEIEAFGEQMRLKDEKLEAFRWRLLSMELESKRLHSHIEGLDHDITQLRQGNMKLEGLLLDREAELNSLKEQLVLQFNPPNLQKLNFNPSLHEAAIAHNTVWSKVKIIKRKPGQKCQETKDIVLTLHTPNKDTLDVKEAAGSADSEVAPPSGETSLAVVSAWKMDIHALGVSYKIKRLKQQLLMLERLTGKQESCESGNGLSGFYALISLLNKQIDRYESLQGKADDICKRMHEKNQNLKWGCSVIAKTDEECKRLEHFLEETFQLQRYIVATGQKLMEVQTKIASGFDNEAEGIEKPASFDMKRFADSIRTLFREVQRGLEVRISRIIGDLEGTLACDGIMHFKK